jgi:hypothetical protein
MTLLVNIEDDCNDQQFVATVNIGAKFGSAPPASAAGCMTPGICCRRDDAKWLEQFQKKCETVFRPELRQGKLECRSKTGSQR